MFGILDSLEQWIKDLLISFISSNLTTLYDDVNTKVGTIATEVGKTPQTWNSSIFSMIETLSNNVMVPIAGIIITFVLCYELITMVTEKNNMHDFDTFMFFRFFFKAAVAVYLVSNTFTITMAVFDLAQHVITQSGNLITDSTSVDIQATITTMQTEMKTMEIGGLLQLAVETLIISLCLKIMSILITVILYGRMIEIYLTVSIAPIPFATMTNREWGHIGTNYFKSLFALGFQGFFMMVIVAIYAVLVNNLTVASDIHSALFSVGAYTVLLCFALMKTGSLSKALFGTH